MPEINNAIRMRKKIVEIIKELNIEAKQLRTDGWHVTATEITNAVILLRDVERRLRAGNDWKI